MVRIQRSRPVSLIIPADIGVTALSSFQRDHGLVGRGRFPVTEEIAGSNPAGRAIFRAPDGMLADRLFLYPKQGGLKPVAKCGAQIL